MEQKLFFKTYKRPDNVTHEASVWADNEDDAENEFYHMEQDLNCQRFDDEIEWTSPVYTMEDKARNAEAEDKGYGS